MQLIDGKLVAKVTREEIANEVAGLKAKGLKNEIGLAVIFVGDNPASQVYVRSKIKACEEVGMKSFLCKLPEDSTYED
ncbi:MAG: bifunctional 5,10-methylene-tetrahydrofolate dehydrogenase/5,10-methylene-tetrahydrofolate cyclohydrolase, partial [Clostridia bacterium]|nr:bifunctional 5,10-methylene-tetrahydrofolate dehydrogenase/5,10-methylene-tetrahydrofolate cyclohydrolase [Clostridia bacterium]